MLRAHLNLLWLAAENIVGNPNGYLAAVIGLVAPLSLLLSGVAISEGLKEDALRSVDEGANLYCTWDMFGRDAAVPKDKVDALAEANGVIRAVPRIIGRINLGSIVAVVIGVPLEQVRNAAPSVVGRLPEGDEDVLVGHELSRLVGLEPGDTVALDADALRLFTVSGIVSSTSPLWSARAIVCDIHEAAILFGEPDHVTDVCLYTRPGYEALVAEAIERIDPRYRVQTRSLVHKYVARGLTIREGVFTALFALALAWAIPSFAILTFMGATPRRRTIGLLKAEGWRTTHVLQMIMFENLLVSFLSAGVAVLLAMLWVRLLRAPLIAPLFIADLPLFPDMQIPAAFLPLPAMLAVIFGLVVTMTGSVFTTWRTAITKPVEVLR